MRFQRVRYPSLLNYYHADHYPVIPRRSPISHPARGHESIKTSFDDLLNSITHSLGTTPKPVLPHLHNLLRAYSSNPEHWAKYAHRNPAKQYTRNLVCELPGIFNLLILVWTPGQASPIHDHADSHCLMKVCFPFSPFRRHLTDTFRFSKDSSKNHALQSPRTLVMKDLSLRHHA